MKTSTNTRSRTAALLTLAILITGSAMAATDGESKEKRKRRNQEEERGAEKHPWREEGKAFREAQREKIKAHMEAQRNGGEEFREAVREEEDPHQAVAMVKSQRTKRNEENTTFFQGIHDENVAFLESMFAEHEVPEEKQTEIMEKLEGRTAKRRDKHEERYEKAIDVLDELAAKEDLTKKDIRDAMKTLHGNRRKGKCGGAKGGRGRDKDKGRDPNRGVHQD